MLLFHNLYTFDLSKQVTKVIFLKLQSVKNLIYLYIHKDCYYLFYSVSSGK